MSKKHIREAVSILKNNIYITIATSSLDSRPWASPLFTAYDKDLRFYWMSPKDSLHSKNIEENENISIVCFDSNAPKWEGIGVYMNAKAYKVTNAKEILHGVKLIYTRLAEPVPALKKFKGIFAYRLYCAKPSNISISVTDTKNGEEIDSRKELDIKSIIDAL